jgi:hypothetical protein
MLFKIVGILNGLMALALIIGILKNKEVDLECGLILVMNLSFFIGGVLL